MKQIRQNLKVISFGISAMVFALNPAHAGETVAAGQPLVEARADGEGPYNRLILRNAILIDGTGAPAQGPFDIVIANDKIDQIKSIGSPGAIDERERAQAGDREIDLTGHYVMPGFIDSHVHLHTLQDGQAVPPDYVLKLWLAHGVTTVRDVGSGQPIEWLAKLRERSATNKITAPRIKVFPFFHDILTEPVNDAAKARFAIREAKRRGADGVKFIGGAKDVLFAALDEAEKIGLPTTMHHAQQVVAYADVLETSNHGLDSMEHWYGLPEAMLVDRQLQDFPNDFVNNDEMMRFGEAGRLWKQAARAGSDRWKTVIDTLLERDFVLSPTFTAYLTSRDFMRMSRAQWHDEYTLPALWKWYKPSRQAHGSYWFNWTTEHEMAWRENYRLWMAFVNEYKNRGGKVTVGSDSGYIYNLYGFGYIQEMELLREAGFTPLEVIHAATGVGAEALGVADQVGTVRVGRKADLAIVEGNPLQNLRLLFGTGTLVLGEDGKVRRQGGIKYTIKDGIVYDAVKLRADVRQIVKDAKDTAGISPGAMPIADIDLTVCATAETCGTK